MLRLTHCFHFGSESVQSRLISVKYHSWILYSHYRGGHYIGQILKRDPLRVLEDKWDD